MPPGLQPPPAKNLTVPLEPVATQTCRHQVVAHREATLRPRLNVIQALRWGVAVCAAMLPCGEDALSKTDAGLFGGHQFGAVDSGLHSIEAVPSMLGDDHRALSGAGRH